ncbi:TonB-dependent receptor [Sphingomonas sp. KR1UV-12]|uniref:TonB-dependent receptor n=1 Tax=Sphingomonas aurea TaxID=3063994 RepID=A0ABT9EM73_9SPHN|nr:TonB-dependent receptor [Sphingomonas sp. KR1UV-12]MDP1028062.1 TonB-dependent receptor [Sphingomonas sp. KR1UV-12]
MDRVMALLCSVAVMPLMAGAASRAEAQVAPTPADATADQNVTSADGAGTDTTTDKKADTKTKRPATSSDEILVTGSRIRRTDLTTSAPLAIIDKDMIGDRGLGRLSDVLSLMPQIAPMTGDRGSSTDPRKGPARINLRGLGSGRTLVLLNGDRMDNDANVIPAPMLERIDILTGGASAVYGSDAIAGVVNYIVKRRFTGVQLNFEASAQQSTNDNQFMLNLLDDAGYPRPPRHAFGGEAYFGSIAAGQNFAKGRGNISVFATYNRLMPMKISMFDHTGCPVYQNAPDSAFLANDTWACGFNEANPYNWFGAGGGDWTNAKDGSRNFRPYDVDDITRTPQNDWLQRRVNRVNTGGFLTFDITSSMKLDSNFLYSSDKSGGEVQFSNWFYSPGFMMPCDNPFLSAQQAQIICGDNAGQAGQSEMMWMNVYRPDNTGRYTYAVSTWRAAAHLSGKLVDDMTFDLGFQRSKRVENYAGTNIFDQGKAPLFIRAMQVVNFNGVPTCQSVVDGTDPNCIPLDGFTSNGPNPAVWSYLTSSGSSQVKQEQMVINGSIAGRLDKYGIKSPFASDGVGFALVAEHRWNRVSEQGFGAFSWWSKYSGVDTVDELGGELSLPIVQAKPLLEDLTISGAYRASKYKSLDNLVQTWKADFIYRPFAGLGFRGSINRAVRRGFLERLQGSVPYQNYFEDRCAMPGKPQKEGDPQKQRLTFEQCAPSGITQQQYDALAVTNNCDQNGFCLTQFRPGGNPNLRPETSRSITAGIVTQPRFLPGFSASLDYYSIKIQGAFEWVRTDLISDQCFNQHTEFFCGLISRDPSDGRVTEINARYNNSGFVRTDGIDFGLYYPIRLSKDRIGINLGQLNLSLNGTVFLKNDRQFAPGTPVYSCLGYFGFFCNDLTPRYRHYANIGWDMPWKGNINLTWRYAAPTINAKRSSDPVLASKPTNWTTDTYPLIPRLPPQNLFDLSITYPLTRNVQVWFNTQNLFDKDPPIIGYGANGTGSFQNTYPWYYNNWGRTLRVGLRAKVW